MSIPFFESLTISWRDILDIILVSMLFYNIVLMIRKTKAVAAIYGLIIIIFFYYIARLIGLNTLTWIYEGLFSSLLLIAIVVFQDDIRQWFIRIGARQWVVPFFPGKKKEIPVLQNIAEAVVHMASKRIGALIVFERNVPLGATSDGGVFLDAVITKELLIALFWPNSPMHDGAIVVRRSRLVSAKCILPLSQKGVKKSYGTRHRAALGITEETDAVSLVVSEERGIVSICVNGYIAEPELTVHGIEDALITAMGQNL